MLRRPFCGMAVCFLLGILCAAYLGTAKGIRLSPILVFVWIVLLHFVRYLSGDVRLLRIRITVYILMVCIGFGQYVNEQAKRERYLPELTDGMSLTVQGEVAGKQLQNNQYIYELAPCFLGAYQSNLSAQELIRCNRILAYSNSDVASIGEILVLNGKVKLWDSAVNEGNFDALSFYLARKIDFGMRDITILSSHGKKSIWRETLFNLKNRLKEIYQTTMTQEAGGVLTTMVLGDKTLLDEDTKRLYQTAGLSHIMAISGLHISVIGMSIYQFLRKRGTGFWCAGSMAGLLLYLYGTMVGMGISVQRSVGMFALFLIAQAIGRGYDSLNALGVMALVLLWRNPFLPWDAGFQFSFVAIIGVAWLGRCISFENVSNGKMKEKLFVSASVLMATLPLAAWHYYEVPMYALPVNMLVLPLMGILLVLGVAGGGLGLVWMQGAGILLFFCEKMLDLVCLVCGFCKKLPQSMVIVGRPKLWQVLCYYAALTWLAFWAYRKKEEKRAQEKNGAKSEKKSGIWVAVYLAIAVTVLLFPASRHLELDILDVGQGDGAFLRTGEGYTVFVDGGSTNIKQVGTYRILPFLKYKGARQIDFWFVSHTDEDHISGLREILEAGYKVKHLVFAENIIQDETYEKLQSLAEANNTQIVHVSAKDMLHLGEARIHVLYPGAEEVTDKNAASLVVLYEENNFSVLFTGDIGSEQEMEVLLSLEDLVRQGKIRGMEIDVYKAAHHGSKYSNSAELLNALRPEIATVSCAKKNSYGHPGEETLQRLGEVDCRVLRTDQVGEIRITMDKEGNIWGVESMK